jgi:hypothetical protein
MKKEKKTNPWLTILKGERLKTFLLKSGKLSPWIFITVLEVLARMSQEKETKGSQIGNKEVKLFLPKNDSKKIPNSIHASTNLYTTGTNKQTQ